MSNQYLLKPKYIGEIRIFSERSTLEHIYDFPADYLIIGVCYVEKLREFNFLVKGNKFFLIYFTRNLSDGEIIFERENKHDMDSKGRQEVNVGVDPSEFNALSDNEKSNYITNLIAKILKEYYVGNYSISPARIEEVESLILKYGGDLEVVYKIKETNRYKLTISYQTKGHDKASVIVECHDKSDNRNLKQILPLRWYDDIDQLVNSIKVRDGILEVGVGNWEELNEILNHWDPIGILPFEEGPKDEYHDVIEPIIDVLENNKGKRQLLEVLRLYQLKTVGLSSIALDTEEFAKKILKWWNEKKK